VGYNLEFSRALANLNRTYRQFECLELCTLQKRIELNCSCYNTALPSFQSSIPCVNSTQLACLNAVYEEQLKKITSITIECIQTSCPMECDTYTYETKVTSLEYPSVEYYNLLRNDTTSYNSIQNKYEINVSTRDLYRQYFYSLNF